MDIKALDAYGANTGEGLSRCMNNEDFYLRMVDMVLNDKNFAALKAAIDASDARSAFEAAHALKGATGNVSLTPLYEPICELTESLRGSDVIPEGSHALLETILANRDKALAL